MWKLFILTLSVMCFYGETKYNPERKNNWIPNDSENEIATRKSYHFEASPPDHTKLVAMARYVLHNCGKKCFLAAYLNLLNHNPMIQSHVFLKYSISTISKRF